MPEGDDKPLKYPLMYQVSDVVLINKIDAMDYFDFSIDKARERILALNPPGPCFSPSAPKPARVWTPCATGSSAS